MKRVDWKLVGLFYGLAFGWVSLVALGLYAAGARNLGIGALQVFQVTIAILYMPAPMVAALIVERVQGRGYFIRETFRHFPRKIPRLLLSGIAVTVGAFASMFALSWFVGEVLGVPGIGRLITTPQALLVQFRSLFGPAVVKQVLASGAGLPSPWVILAVSLAGGIVAGFTLNALFAFGEEYGWRGWLMNELEPLGAVRANILTGALWGLWHTPIILLGFNYGSRRFVGPLFMVVLCIPFSFLLWRMRQYTGTVLGACVGHGAFNGFAGAFVLLLAGRVSIWGAPAGLLGAASMAIVAGVFWAATARHLWHDPTPAGSGALSGASAGGSIPSGEAA